MEENWPLFWKIKSGLMDSMFSNVFVEMYVATNVVETEDAEQMEIRILNTLHRGVVRNGLRADFWASKGVFLRNFPIKSSG